MSRKRTVYTAEYKTRLVLEVLKEEKLEAFKMSSSVSSIIIYPSFLMANDSGFFI